MASLNEIAFNILNIARGGLSSDDDRLNIRQIKFWVKYYRAKLIYEDVLMKEKLKKNKVVDPQLIQDMGCLELESLDKAVCPEVLWGCGEIKRIAIPKLIDTPLDKSMIWVGLVDKQTAIPLNNASVASFKKYSRFVGNIPRAYIIGDHLYISEENTDIKYINVRGVFDDPSSVSNCDKDGNCCPLTDDDKYPMPERYISDITALIMQRELNIVNMINDEVNDSREDTGQESKEVKPYISTPGIYEYIKDDIEAERKKIKETINFSIFTRVIKAYFDIVISKAIIEKKQVKLFGGGYGTIQVNKKLCTRFNPSRWGFVTENGVKKRKLFKIDVDATDGYMYYLQWFLPYGRYKGKYKMKFFEKYSKLLSERIKQGHDYLQYGD